MTSMAAASARICRMPRAADRRAGPIRHAGNSVLSGGPTLVRAGLFALLVAAPTTISVAKDVGGSALDFVGSAACAGCHEAEFAAWRGSHHDLAMQEATDKTVLGDFHGATFTYGDLTSRFFERDGRFFVNTDGPDGKLADFEIRYTFGVTPCSNT